MFWKFVERTVAAAGLAAAVWAGTPAGYGQTAPPPVSELPSLTGKEGEGNPPPPPPVGPMATLTGVPAAGCASCGSGCANGDPGCGEGGCYAGVFDCDAVAGRGPFTRLYAAYHNALCCPDPCYVPKWKCAANAAFFVDTARPITMTRLRWDHGENLTAPDRAEYFWARQAVSGGRAAERRVDYDELHLYQEAGIDRFSLFIDLPYRSNNPTNNGRSGGIGDLQIGTKSLLLDSELVQTTFQFVTTIPTAGPGRGVGTGHVSLDPSLVNALKLREGTYLQSQIGYWFGVGNSNGSLVHYSNSINQVLWQPTCGTELIGTLEGVGYTFTSGSVTLPNGAVTNANGVTYLSVGPGLRWCMCGKLDFGLGTQFAITKDHFGQQTYRTEIRFRF